MNDFEKQTAEADRAGLLAQDIKTVQVNVGLRCNQACAHCHLNASPHRTETMTWPIMERVLKMAGEVDCERIDLTGGAPELNPRFRRFVEALRGEGHTVQVRTNLTVLLEPGMETMPEFFRDHDIQLVASMPCYLEENVRAQRGERVYEKSVEAIRRLNALGYGREDERMLNLVYNPGGPFLPPEQAELEDDYRRELDERFSITFSNLLTITNMPIGRFRAILRRQGQEQEYLRLLRTAFNPQTIDGLMCRHQLSVGWDGTLYDCDFNLALGSSVNHGAPDHIERFDLSDLLTRRVVTGEHCFSCTAGCGSSCGGALVDG